MGNAKDEGFKYRGRGMIQLTGKDNYARIGKKIGVDLVKNPDLANRPDVAAKVAASYFSGMKGNQKSTDAVTKYVGPADQATYAVRRQMASDLLKTFN